MCVSQSIPAPLGGLSLTPYKMRISTAHLLQLTFVTIMHTAALILFLLGKQSWQGEELGGSWRGQEDVFAGRPAPAWSLWGVIETGPSLVP